MTSGRNRTLTRNAGALLALALSAAACHGSPSATTTPEAQPEAKAEPTPFDDLNLGFERADTPEGWDVSRSPYAVKIDDGFAFEGEHSLRLVHDGQHESGRVSLELPIESTRGKTVRARAQVRTSGVDLGGVQMMLTAKRGHDYLDRVRIPPPQQVRGSTEWTPITVELAVPAEAEGVTLTLDHAGTGVAWFDGVELEVGPTDGPPPPATLRGQVLDPEGKPVPDATVAAFQPTGDHETLTTDAEGRFELAFPPGAAVVGVGAAAGVAASQVELRPGDNEPLTLTLAKGSQRLHGRVVDQDGKPYGHALALVATEDMRVYPVRTADDGTWSMEVPPAGQYMAMFMGSGAQRVTAMIDDPKTAVETTLSREAGPPPAALTWIGEHAVPLSSTEPGSGLDDLTALDSAFAEATVVGLGEATHGTREFFTLKHRMLEYLVEHHGFTVFAIEASRPDARAIERYVQTGEGDPKEALSGLGFWTWDTEEVLALIEWMRQYNSSHETKLHFVGFDAQAPRTAAANLDAFLAQVDPDVAQRPTVQAMARPFEAFAFQQQSPADHAAMAKALDELAAHMDAHHDAWAEAKSPDATLEAREDLEVLRQVLSQRTAGPAWFQARDRAMADNVLHIEERFGKGTKTVLWAHNGHVARAWADIPVMGRNLADALGERYVSVGFAFDRGGFQAIAMEGERWGGLRNIEVGSAAHPDLEATLRDGGPELFALDLRPLPSKGAAAKWLRSPLPMRQIGANFAQDDMSCRVIEPVTDRYDVLLFVEETTRAVPVRD